jgi:hypothetical protein
MILKLPEQLQDLLQVKSGFGAASRRRDLGGRRELENNQDRFRNLSRL